MLGVFPTLDFGPCEAWHAACRMNRNLMLERDSVEDGDDFVSRVIKDAADLFFEYHILALQNAGILIHFRPVADTDFPGLRKFCRFVMYRACHGDADMPESRDHLYKWAKTNAADYLQEATK